MKILKLKQDHINKYTMKNKFLIFIIMLISTGSFSQERIISADTSKTTKHSTIILNKKVNYSAQIGTQPIVQVAETEELEMIGLILEKLENVAILMMIPRFMNAKLA